MRKGDWDVDAAVAEFNTISIRRIIIINTNRPVDEKKKPPTGACVNEMVDVAVSSSDAVVSM